jgi:hypothetical protein
MNAAEFIGRWRDSGAAEMANSQSFVKELCELLSVPQPDPSQQDESANTYVFEKAIKFNNGDGSHSDGRSIYIASIISSGNRSRARNGNRPN